MVIPVCLQATINHIHTLRILGCSMDSGNILRFFEKTVLFTMHVSTTGPYIFLILEIEHKSTKSKSS